MSRDSRKSLELADRRKKVAELYFSDLSQQEIAEMLDVSQSTVSRDVEWLLKKLTSEAIDEYSEQRALFLAKLDRDERELRKQYRLSHFKSRRRDPLTKKLEYRLETSILDAIDKIRTQRAKVWGLYAPEKHDLTGAKILVMDK
jgi:predicted transcriptional regulator